MFNRIIEFLGENLLFFIVLFMCLMLVIMLNNRIYKLWYVQSEIVMHDYGQVFESIEDWKLYRLEKLESRD